MQNSVAIVINNAKDIDRKNCLYFPSNTLFDLMLPEECDFYTHIKPEYACNASYIDNSRLSAIGADINCGFINNIQNSIYKITKHLEALHINGVVLQHNICNIDARTVDIVIETLGSNCSVVFTSNEASDLWPIEGEVVPYGFAEQPEIEKDIPLLIAGNTGYNPNIIQAIKARHKDAHYIGFNKGATPPYRTLKDITKLMNRAKFTVCLHAEDEPPLFAMLAMSCSSCPITNKSILSSNLINDEINGFFISSINEIDAIVKSVPNSKLTSIQQRARDTILHHFPIEPFNTAISEIIRDASRKAYIR